MRKELKLVNFILVHHGLGLRSNKLSRLINFILLIINFFLIATYTYQMWTFPIAIATKISASIIVITTVINLILFKIKQKSIRSLFNAFPAEKIASKVYGNFWRFLIGYFAYVLLLNCYSLFAALIRFKIESIYKKLIYSLAQQTIKSVNVSLIAFYCYAINLITQEIKSLLINFNANANQPQQLILILNAIKKFKFNLIKHFDFFITNWFLIAFIDTCLRLSRIEFSKLSLDKLYGSYGFYFFHILPLAAMCVYVSYAQKSQTINLIELQRLIVIKSGSENANCDFNEINFAIENIKGENFNFCMASFNVSFAFFVSFLGAALPTAVLIRDMN